MPFSPVTAPNLADEAANQIRQLIATDVLRPGDALPGERELATRMGISRTSIRSALKALISEGLLISQHGSGLKVSEEIGASISDPLIPVLESMSDIFDHYLNFRIVLEGESAAEAAKKATTEECEEIERAHNTMLMAVENEDMQSAYSADIEFHMAIVEAAGNIVTIQVMRSLHELLRRWVERSHKLSSVDQKTWKNLVKQHARIIKAIRKKDSGLARTAMYEHLEYQKRLLHLDVEYEKRQQLTEKRRAWIEEQNI